MRIVYVSNNNPFNINNWSGTPHLLISALRNHHAVVWIGGGVIKGSSCIYIVKRGIGNIAS